MSRILTFALAAALSLIAPTARATTTNLQADEGAAFDRAFTEQMIKEHQEAIELIHATAYEGKDSNVSRNGRS